MPSKHKMPLIGWHPRSAELAAWIRAEAERRGSLADVLEEALEEARRAAHLDNSTDDGPRQNGSEEGL